MPLWERLDPPTADSLAELSGVSTQTLYGVNGGSKNLGMKAAEKIARAMKISVYDLNAPRPSDPDFALALLGQIVPELERNPPREPGLLRELAADLRALASRLEAVAERLAGDSPP